jgi:serine/threonine-protein kinase RsbW
VGDTDRMRDLPEDSAEELYEDAPCGYLSTLPDGEIVKVNATFLRWTEFRREELVGRRRFQDLLTGGGRIYHETHYAPLLRMQGEVHEIALDVVCASGRRLPVLVNAALKRDAVGTPLLVRTTIFDASERRGYERELLHARDAERAARERTERLQALTAALAAPLDRTRIAETVVEALAAGAGASEADVALVDEETGRLALVAGSAGDSPWIDDAVATLEDGRPHFADAPATGTPRGAVGLAPLIVDDRTIGVLRVLFAEVPSVPDDGRAFVLAVAGQAALAFERARLLADTARAAARFEYLAELSRGLDEVDGPARRVERLVALLVPRLADHAALQPESREGAPEVARRALATDEPQLSPDSRGGSSRVALPLRALGRGLGALVLVREHPRRFRSAELPFLSDLADRAALALENGRLYEQQREVARVLQRSLLAGTPPRDARFEVAAEYRPAVETLEVGGDWHDCFAIGDDRVAIVVGEVVGRGIEAASAMGQLRSAIRALAGAQLGPGALLDRLDTFVEALERARYATVAYAEIALDSGAMTYACAGHPPPMLLEPGRDTALLWDGRSPLVGANFSGAPRPQAEQMLARDARVLLYTDGLVERRDRPLEDGFARLALELGRRRDAELPALVEELTGALLADFSGADDVCALCFRLLSAAGVADRTPVGTAAGAR